MPAACGCAARWTRDAGRRGAGAARRAGPVRWRPRLARYRTERRSRQGLGGQLDRAPVGTGYPDWRKAVVLSKGGGQATIGFTNGSTGTLPASGDAAMPKRGVGGARVRFPEPGMVIIVKQVAGSTMRCGRCRKFRAECWRRKSTLAACSRCRAGSTSSGQVTIARPRRFASRARRSSRSSM